MTAYALHVLVDVDEKSGQTDELVKECQDLGELAGALQQLEVDGRAWRVITIVHLEDLPLLMDGAERACIRCGCTDSHTCDGGCSWATVDPPVCSRCVVSIDTLGSGLL